MATVKIAGGAEIDLATGAEVAAQGDRMASLFGAAVIPPASYQRRAASVAPTSSTLPTYLDLGGPADGVLWEVRMILLTWAPNGAFGAAISQPIAILVSGAPLTNLGPVDVVDLGLATPVSFLYASDALIAQAPEHVYVGVLASAAQVATAGGQFVATMRAAQIQVRKQSDIETAQH